jgi:hypothetical protein
LIGCKYTNWNNFHFYSFIYNEYKRHGKKNFCRQAVIDRVFKELDNSFCAKLYGMRRAANKALKVKELIKSE